MKEFVDVVDENDNELGFSKDKDKVHVDGDWHRAAHLWIVKDGKVLFQERAVTKDFYPGCYDLACAGHVMAGESYEDGLMRELEEELGLKVDKKNFIFIKKQNAKTKVPEKNLISNEILKIYLLFFEGDLNDIQIQEEELSGVKLMSIDEARLLLETDPSKFTCKPYVLEMLELIENKLRGEKSF